MWIRDVTGIYCRYSKGSTSPTISNLSHTMRIEVAQTKEHELQREKRPSAWQEGKWVILQTLQPIHSEFTVGIGWKSPYLANGGSLAYYNGGAVRKQYLLHSLSVHILLTVWSFYAELSSSKPEIRYDNSSQGETYNSISREDYESGF